MDLSQILNKRRGEVDNVQNYGSCFNIPSPPTYRNLNYELHFIILLLLLVIIVMFYY
jgi:hypothetical protein